MTNKQLDQWVAKLGRAWESLDTDAALALVHQSKVEWHESPFADPLTTWQAVYDTWKSALADQRDVSFSHQVLACDNKQGVARWQATLTRISTSETVQMDGIFLVTLDDQNLCTNFMMWIETK